MRYAKVACAIPQAAWRGWQMLRTFLEAVTQERGLSVCPLIGHMAGHCGHSALCVSTTIMSHILLQYVDSTASAAVICFIATLCFSIYSLTKNDTIQNLIIVMFIMDY